MLYYKIYIYIFEATMQLAKILTFMLKSGSLLSKIYYVYTLNQSVQFKIS